MQGVAARLAFLDHDKADLGELAEGLGRKDEALKWYAEGYAEARGPATRFQWGDSTAASLMRLEPNDADKILECHRPGPRRARWPHPDLYRRARMRLARLDKVLRKWNTDTGNVHHAVIVGLRDRMQHICVKIPQAERAQIATPSWQAHDPVWLGPARLLKH